MARKFVLLLVVASFAGFAVAFAGCGGDDNNSAATTETTATTTETTPTTEATETTSTETTEATETTATTETSALNDFATAKNCREFATIGSKISSALTGSTDVQDVQDAFDQLTAAAPAEIKGDFQTLSDYFGEIADALQGYDPSSGQPPSADALAKLQSIDTTAVTQASQNIAKWTTDNCTS